MPRFVCSKCGCIDNTATGHYWAVSLIKFKPGALAPEHVGKPLCCECAPAEFEDGTHTGYGRWHNRFPKEHWTQHHKKMPQGTF